MKQPFHSTGQRLETTIRPELALRLTPQMQLRLNILQANIQSLEDMVTIELEQNPALEIIEGEPGKEEETSTERVTGESEELPEELTHTKEFSVDDFYPSDLAYGSEAKDDMPEPGSPVADRSSLKEHMIRAIAREFRDCEQEYRIAQRILEGLDEDGFFHEELESIAQELEVEPERVESVRLRIQNIEPVGLASRDIREALIAQLRAMGYDDDSPEIKILQEGFEAFLQKRITSLSNNLKLPTAVVTKAFETICSLDPKPGRNLLEMPYGCVQPDITLSYREGRLLVLINEGPLPPLRLSARVRQILENPKHFSREEIEFARQKLESAQLFIKSILQRRDTLMRMAENILMRNYDFFSGRTQQLTPILMKDVADSLGLHTSTISRAVRDKYIETPVGIFPLRSFFSKGEQNPILSKLETIIKSEDRNNPLTDAEIADIFLQKGVKISRRTVAKYRLLLNIPDRFQRKALSQ